MQNIFLTRNLQARRLGFVTCINVSQMNLDGDLGSDTCMIISLYVCFMYSFGKNK